jgi:hypothetical protein
LSAPFATTGLDVQSPVDAAAKLVGLLLAGSPGGGGAFVDNQGRPIAW